MNIICKITDTDIGEEYTELENPRVRLAARGIVIKEDGKIAVFNNVLRDRRILEYYMKQIDEKI